MQLRRALAAIAGIAALTVGFPSTAGAQTTDDDVTPSALAPQCIDAALDDDGFTDYLTLINFCNRNYRVKVVLAFHTDMSCRTILDGEEEHYQWNWPGRFDRVELC
jgi:hypothetical protein